MDVRRVYAMALLAVAHAAPRRARRRRAAGRGVALHHRGARARPSIRRPSWCTSPSASCCWPAATSRPPRTGSSTPRRSPGAAPTGSRSRTRCCGWAAAACARATPAARPTRSTPRARRSAARSCPRFVSLAEALEAEIREAPAPVPPEPGANGEALSRRGAERPRAAAQRSHVPRDRGAPRRSRSTRSARTAGGSGASSAPRPAARPSPPRTGSGCSKVAEPACGRRPSPLGFGWRTVISTRRFCARPFSPALLAIGSLLPCADQLGLLAAHDRCAGAADLHCELGPRLALRACGVTVAAQAGDGDHPGVHPVHEPASDRRELGSAGNHEPGGVVTRSTGRIARVRAVARRAASVATILAGTPPKRCVTTAGEEEAVDGCTRPGPADIPLTSR